MLKEELMNKLRNIFNMWDISPYPEEKFKDFKQYDEAIKDLLEKISKVKNKEDLEKILKESFGEQFWIKTANKNNKENLVKDLYNFFKSNNLIRG